MKTNKIEHIKLLIDKYYEGLTSKEEERRISKFLVKNPDLQGFEAERAIFGYIHKKKSYTLNAYWKYSIAASIALIISFALVLQINNKPKAYAWVDGKEVTDVEIVKALAKESLQNVAANANIIETTLEPFKTNNNKIKKQLSVFSDVEF